MMLCKPELTAREHEIFSDVINGWEAMKERIEECEAQLKKRDMKLAGAGVRLDLHSDLIEQLKTDVRTKQPAFQVQPGPQGHAQPGWKGGIPYCAQWMGPWMTGSYGEYEPQCIVIDLHTAEPVEYMGRAVLVHECNTVEGWCDVWHQHDGESRKVRIHGGFVIFKANYKYIDAVYKAAGAAECEMSRRGMEREERNETGCDD